MTSIDLPVLRGNISAALEELESARTQILCARNVLSSDYSGESFRVYQTMLSDICGAIEEYKLQLHALYR